MLYKKFCSDCRFRGFGRYGSCICFEITAEKVGVSLGGSANDRERGLVNRGLVNRGLVNRGLVN